MLNEGNQIHNFISSSGSGSDFLTSYGSGSGSTMQKVTVPTVPVPVPQHCGIEHKVHVLYLEYHTVCPFLELGPPHPLSRKRVCPSPWNSKASHRNQRRVVCV
jgi:hypothetical protein